MYDKRYNTFEQKIIDLGVRHECYVKEKYGRVDIEYWGGDPDIDDTLIDIQEDSLRCCQICVRRCKQYWTDFGWMRHYCLWHYIIAYIRWYRTKFKYYFKRRG